MGNKKRSTIDHPVIINKFSKEKVQDIFAGYNKSAVICDEIWYLMFNYNLFNFFCHGYRSL